MPSRSRLLSLVAAVLALPALVLSACGGGSSNDKNATDLLNTAFHQSIKSADVNFDLQVQLRGVPSLSAPISLKLTGPYVNNGPGKLPSFDFSANVSGGGQNALFGVTSTGDDFFVKARGQAYDVGKQQVAKLNQQLDQQKSSGQKTSLSALGIHPSTWLSGAKTVGDAKIGGTPVTHITAKLDMDKLLDDLNQVVQKAPSSSATGAKPPQLTDKQKSEIKKVVGSPQLDVYVSKSDHTLRRLAGGIQLTIPKDQQSQLGGASGGTLQLSIEFANVGQSKRISAPSGARPISELAGRLQALGGALGAGGTGAGSGTTGGSDSGGGSGAATPSAKQFQAYAECIQKAGSNDAAALQKCADLLR